MRKFYFTFGRIHRHEVDGQVFDKDCVVEIEAPDEGEARLRMSEQFGLKWAFCYTDLEKVGLHHYPRGIIPLVAAVKYPEHEKLRAVKEESQAIGTFLDMSRYTLCSKQKIECEECCEEVEQYWPVRKTIEVLLAEHFHIDLKKINEEKDAMLAEIRAGNEARNAAKENAE